MSPRPASGLPCATYFSFFFRFFFFLGGGTVWLWPTNCELESQSLQRSLMSVKLTNSTFHNDAEFQWHFSQSKDQRTSQPCRFISQGKQFTVVCWIQSTWTILVTPWRKHSAEIVFHGLCPNDWWHFLRHLRRWPIANIEHYLNAKRSKSTGITGIMGNNGE